MKNIVLWVVQSASLKVASFRIRCAYVIKQLELYGVSSLIVENNDQIIDYFDCVKAIVFVKNFGENSSLLALKARENGVPIFLDLCDNIFVKNYPQKYVSHFSVMSRQCAALIVPTVSLRSIVLEEDRTLNVLVIPDQLDLNSKNLIDSNFVINHKIKASHSFLFSWISILKFYIHKKVHTIIAVFLYALRRFKYILKRITTLLSFSRNINFAIKLIANNKTERKRLVWFGNHGANHGNFGIESLYLIKEELEILDSIYSIELLIISNNFNKANWFASLVGFPVLYKDWSLDEIESDLKSAAVCLIPNSRDEFSISKSANRLILSLSCGVPVVVTNMQIYEDFSQCILVNDFVVGVSSYLDSKELIATHIKHANFIISDKYSADAISRQWLNVLKLTEVDQ
jgi:glycosyltransferase involved in cell wall biosynthesis